MSNFILHQIANFHDIGELFQLTSILQLYKRSIFVSVVMIDPPGPIYIPILKQKNITCSVEGVDRRQLNSLVMLFSDINPITSFITKGKVIQGIDITFISQSRARALISINTDNTSIIGLRCGSLTRSLIIEESTLNLTIYGE